MKNVICLRHVSIRGRRIYDEISLRKNIFRYMILIIRWSKKCVNQIVENMFKFKFREFV